MDENGADHTEWSKPERKTPIQYTNTHIWNLGRWQWRPCMQESKWDSYVLFFLIFIFTLFYFTILYWFCHTLTWIHHGCTCVPKHEPPSPLPPHNIPLGYPRAPAPSMLYPASDIDWRFDSYMIVYMLQCHSPKSSHLSLSLWVQKSVIHICVFFAVLHTGSSLPSF